MMKKIFIGVFTLISISMTGCGCDKKKPTMEQMARSCMSSPECMMRANQAAMQQQMMMGAPAVLPYNGHTGILGGAGAQQVGQQPVVLPGGANRPATAYQQQATNAQIQARAQSIQSQLNSAPEVHAQRDPAQIQANQNALTQNQQVQQDYSGGGGDEGGGIR